MFRAPLRRLRPASLPASRVPTVVSRRAASTAAGPAKKGTWKGTAARWGVAVGAVYWYCTSPLFADDPARRFLAPKSVLFCCVPARNWGPQFNACEMGKWKITCVLTVGG